MSTIFGEEHFFDKSMISIIEERGNAIDNFIYDEIAGVAKYELPMPKIIINREKVKKWLILCSQLENLEHSELIGMATKKKLADKDSMITTLLEDSKNSKDFLKKQLAEQPKQIVGKIRKELCTHLYRPFGADEQVIDYSDFIVVLDTILKEYSDE